MSTPVVRRSPTHQGVVLANAPLTPRMRRVTVSAQSMRAVAIRPAQDVELLLREPSGRRVKRRYTIRHARPDVGELDLDVLLHAGPDGSGGPGARWGETAQAGDPVEFQGPRGKLDLRPAAAHLLVGDESALPAIAAICDAVPATETTVAVIEVQDSNDELPLAADDVRWVHRGLEAPGSSEHLAAALDQLEVRPETHAYLMGETRAMVALRAQLEGAGLPHEAIFVKGYWNVGRPDRIAGRAPA